ncbi:Zinc finger AN1 domain-containing stress-associated protein 15 [Platanthera zijinensis]|uniref:Zinc finger AN1 domain-containing stress-associated protein 15 n=1 Tax=Platanthera zijinensis TaxID=2320716 RepID=A0AAP0BPR5_9ASPA
MAPESCNLGKDEAEMLKPPSSSSSSSPTNHSTSSGPSQPPPESPSCLPVEPFGVVQDQRTEKTETLTAFAIKIPSLSKIKGGSRPPAQFGNRCLICRKRTALAGFRCRCGDLFCALHRYSDRHDCSFDYKAAGREEISKANPLVRAAKIIKI